MNENTRFLGLVILVSVMMVVGYFYLERRFTGQKEEMKEYWEKKGFKTDTVYVDVDYSKLPKPTFEYTVPPAQVYYYRDSSVTHIKATLNDSLLTVIDSLKGQITNINHRFFKLYPTSSKILYGSFTSDSLALDLLDIDGKIKTLKYGVNYDRFNYQFKDGALRADKVSKSKPITSDWFGYIGYDAAFKAPTLGSDYSLYKNRWRLKGNTFLTLEQQPQFSAQITLGLRVK